MMKKLNYLLGTTNILKEYHLIIPIYEYATDDFTFNFKHPHFYIDQSTKEIIEQYEPLIQIDNNGEVAFSKETKETIEVYPVLKKDVLLLTYKDFCKLKFNELKAHFLKHYEHDLVLKEKIELWGNTIVAPVEETNEQLLREKSRFFLNLYQRPNFAFSLRNKIIDTYPFDFTLKEFIHNK